MSEKVKAAQTPAGVEVSGQVKFLISAMLFLSYVLFAVAWNWGDLYVRSLGFNASRTALMTNAITLAQVIGSLVAANILLRMGPRHAFTLASGLIVFGGLVSLTEAFPLIFFIRFVLGLGGALMVVLLSGIVARLLTGRSLQVANGLNSVAFNTGLAVARYADGGEPRLRCRAGGLSVPRFVVALARGRTTRAEGPCQRERRGGFLVHDA